MRDAGTAAGRVGGRGRTIARYCSISEGLSAWMQTPTLWFEVAVYSACVAAGTMAMVAWDAACTNRSSLANTAALRP